ncbi:MAG: protein kinase [Fibrobacterales bacterium]
MTNKKSITYKASQKIGSWELIRRIGRGGNGEVWKCKNSNGDERAIKLLKSVKERPYKRFKDETKILEQNSDIDGVLSVVDSDLPIDFERKVPYYVMPLAKSAENELKGKALDIKLHAILGLCKVLEKLHNRNIAHRDIKIANILFLDSKYYLADFGLVDYPSKADVSIVDEQIGPKWTIAPEMQRTSSSADSLKADVYSFAKTIWVIITENSKCFEGQYIPDSIIGLSSSFRDYYIKPLDDLLVKCTSNDPKERLTVQEMIREIELFIFLHNNYHERNRAQWKEIQKEIFPLSTPVRCEWRKKEDIIKVMKSVCKYNQLNHLFFSTGED